MDLNKTLFNKYNAKYDNIGCHINNDNHFIINIDNIKLSCANNVTSYIIKQYDYDISFKAEGFNKNVSFNIKIKDILKKDTIYKIMDYIILLISNQ